MQLKMTNKFNAGLVKQLLQEEDKFLTDIFSKMKVPTTEAELDDDDDDEQPQNKRTKLFHSNGDAKRALTAEELQEKFNELKGQKKLTYKQKQLKKGLKNRIKKKSKREQRMTQKNRVKGEKTAAGETTDVKEENDSAPKVPRAKPVFNSEGHMVFSKFDFSGIGDKKKQQKTEKDPKKILEQLKEKKSKVKELVASGETEKAVELHEKDAWKAALAKASGEKVKDDPELLRKSIKREENLKKRSAKKWEARTSGVEKALQERQRKRTENIMKRKKEKKTNKLKKASNKGRIIPGF